MRLPGGRGAGSLRMRTPALYWLNTPSIPDEGFDVLTETLRITASGVRWTFFEAAILDHSAGAADNN